MTTGTQPLHRRLGMTDDEHESVLGLLGRDPRPAELAMYSVMWWDLLLQVVPEPTSTVPTEAPWVVVGTGEKTPAWSISVTAGWPPFQ